MKSNNLYFGVWPFDASNYKTALKQHNKYACIIDFHLSNLPRMARREVTTHVSVCSTAQSILLLAALLLCFPFNRVIREADKETTFQHHPHLHYWCSYSTLFDVNTATTLNPYLMNQTAQTDKLKLCKRTGIKRKPDFFFLLTTSFTIIVKCSMWEISCFKHMPHNFCHSIKAKHSKQVVWDDGSCSIHCLTATPADGNLRRRCSQTR